MINALARLFEIAPAPSKLRVKDWSAVERALGVGLPLTTRSSFTSCGGPVDLHGERGAQRSMGAFLRILHAISRFFP